MPLTHCRIAIPPPDPVLTSVMVFVVGRGFTGATDGAREYPASKYEPDSGSGSGSSTTGFGSTYG